MGNKHAICEDIPLPDAIPPAYLPPTDPTAPSGNGEPPSHPPLNIEDELKDSYLKYAMSVIISRALPDVRDGLKPSQRRILVAMNDLGLGPTPSTSKCAGIVGETMKTLSSARRRVHLPDPGPHGPGLEHAAIA